MGVAVGTLGEQAKVVLRENTAPSRGKVFELTSRLDFPDPNLLPPASDEVASIRREIEGEDCPGSGPTAFQTSAAGVPDLDALVRAGRHHGGPSRVNDGRSNLGMRERRESLSGLSAPQFSVASVEQEQFVGGGRPTDGVSAPAGEYGFSLERFRLRNAGSV